MADYIERQAVIDMLEDASLICDEAGEYVGYCTDDIDIESIPTANVREDVHGKWVVVEHEYLNCSVCGEAMYTGCSSSKEAMILKDHWKNFCPNCGARMVTSDAPLA